MASPTNDTVMVSWKQFVITIIPMMFLPATISWAVVNAHAALAAHAGAVHVREFERVVTELRDIKANLRALQVQVNIMMQRSSSRRDVLD